MFENLTSEIKLHHFNIGNSNGRFGDSLFVVVVPFASQPFGLIPDLNQILVVLNDDIVLVEAAVQVRLRTARVVHNIEFVLAQTCLRLDINAIVAIHGTLRISKL